MKKFSIYILLSLLVFACNSKQEEIENEINIPKENEEKIPTSFTQKILIEYATSTSIGLSPQATEFVSVERNKRPNKVIAASLHYFNEMQVKNITDYFDDELELYKCIPMGFANRHISQNRDGLDLCPIYPYEWAEIADSLFLKEKTSSGIALQTNYNQESKIINVIIKVGVNSDFDISKNYKLLIYLTEDNIVYPQKNIFSGDDFYIGHDFAEKYYNLPPIITNYVHNDVVRSTFTPINGDNMEINKINTSTEKSYQLQLTDENYQNCNIIAVLLKEVNGQMQVENAQKAKLGENKSWD